MIYHRSDAHEQSLEQDQLYRYDTPTVMILGVAGGNGLEHVDPMRLQAVYDVDINADYLRECQRRYPKLQNVFQPIEADECLGDLHQDISETDLAAAMMDSGYQVRLRQETHLPNGKMLCRIDFFDCLCT